MTGEPQQRALTREEVADLLWAMPAGPERGEVEAAYWLMLADEYSTERVAHWRWELAHLVFSPGLEPWPAPRPKEKSD